jgi:sigma-B regulation protein RsbU (phosphoserine phosphatase)
MLGRIELAADRLLAGDRTTHRNVLQNLGRQMTTILDLDVLRDRVLSTLRDALAVEHAYLVLRTDDAYLIWGSGEAQEGRFPRDHPLALAVAQADGPHLTHDIVAEVEDPERRANAERAMRDLHSRLVVPVELPEGSDALGFLSFGPKVTGNRFTGEEVTLLSILATQIGIAVQNARFHEEAVERAVVDEELAVARSIQESILSGRKRCFPTVDVAALSIPSRQVGGDYYDLVEVHGGGIGIAIGDVSGKGVPAALLMSMLHAALHAQVNGSARIAPTLARMNEILCEATSVDKFATFFYGVFDPAAARFRFTNGGHNFPFLLRADGSILRLEAGGLILGLFPESTYEEAEVALEQGDLMVFFTDGVTEEESPDDEDDLFGEERLLAVIQKHRNESASRLVSEVRREVAAFRGAGGFSDDFTLIVLRPGARPADRESETEVGFR